ncbi:hypothetical protein JDF658_18710 [Carboxydocella sp. JDF658]|nr:hypothetical protein JDF658_18710 [Carboxydocella sp. JDF658]
MGMRKAILYVLIFLFFPFSPVIASNQNTWLLIDLNNRTITALQGNQPLVQFPVAIGKKNSPTPIGNWKVIHKSANWGNGFGSRFLGLDVPWGKYGIHGTNKPWSIGQRASAGCIRMKNQDIERLYPLVKTGTPVVIIGNPFASWSWRPLFRDLKGADVVLVQERLSALGFYQGNADGIFGYSTELAVKNWQKTRKVEITGQIHATDYQALGFR